MMMLPPVRQEDAPVIQTTSALDALRQTRARQLLLTGTLERNQGRPTFTGRMTLEQLVETTTVHNQAWADTASLVDAETRIMQRDIQSSHAVGLTYFLLQGVTAATLQRMEEAQQPISQSLRDLYTRLSPPSSVAIPPVTLVLQEMPEVVTTGTSTSLALSAGTLFLVADGQHRREAARRLRDIFQTVISTGVLPRQAAVLGGGLEIGPVEPERLDAFIALQETFRSWTYIAYEAHLGLSVAETRQLFINYNYHAQPVSADLSLSFDESHPLNVFNKVLQRTLAETRVPMEVTLRQLATITGLAVMGRPNMRRTPRDVEAALDAADRFWSMVRTSKDFRRDGTLLRALPVLKGLAKAFWVVHRAPTRFRAPQSAARVLRTTIKTTVFDDAWLFAIPGMRDLARVTDDKRIAFSPAHNEIIGKIVGAILG